MSGASILEGIERVHMLGIGGIGVSAVARLLHERGFVVSGSDVRASALTDEVAKLGMTVRIGHDRANLDGVDFVVRSTAIPEHNVELVAARALGIPVAHRSEVLNDLLRGYRSIGVTGTHGKGTVSSMITCILEAAGWEPGFVIGGRLENFGINARDTGGEWMVVEVDESDGTHLNFELDYVVCNFLELDHLNYYEDLDDIVANMHRLMVDTPGLKEVFLNLDCAGNRRLAAQLPLRPTGYAVDHATEYQGRFTSADQLPLRFEALRRGEKLSDVELDLPGRYNVVNAMGAVAVAHRIGVPVEAIARGLGMYRGLENRFTIQTGGGVTIVKDYNSHPTCMRKVLRSARDLVDGRIISIFKPYRYTLIKYLQDEYGAAFAGSDEVVITTMYAADEDPIPGVDTELVVQKIRDNGLKVTFIPNQEDINDYLLSWVRPGDKAIFFGGDDFFRMADRFTARLAQRAGEAPAALTTGDVGGPRGAGDDEA
ncbi:MAG: UDP-N-acetylmuramate--L-alanine ligase [Myxococcota bacterium]